MNTKTKRTLCAKHGTSTVNSLLTARKKPVSKTKRNTFAKKYVTDCVKHTPPEWLRYLEFIETPAAPSLSKVRLMNVKTKRNICTKHGISVRNALLTRKNKRVTKTQRNTFVKDYANECVKHDSPEWMRYIQFIQSPSPVAIQRP
jgi:hypothetical protein